MALVLATVDVTRHSERESLVEARNMRCPRCRRLHDVLRYVPMGQIDRYIAETNPVYRCPRCRWVFSPALSLSDKIKEAISLLRLYAPEVLVENAQRD